MAQETIKTDISEAFFLGLITCQLTLRSYFSSSLICLTLIIKEIHLIDIILNKH